MRRGVLAGQCAELLQEFFQRERIGVFANPKGEADAMQYTLPLKQKQIEQSKLEAEARKEATIQNAEADAQAKVIDSKAELRRQLLAWADDPQLRRILVSHGDPIETDPNGTLRDLAATLG